MSSVIAVIPTFSPDGTLLDRLEALAPQVDALIVVDDGSPAASDALLTAVELQGYEVLRLNSNRGIASALNAGIELALARGAEYVLTMDQDSTVPDDYVAACLGAFESASPQTRLGVVCSDRINSMPCIPEAWTAEGLGLVREAIQSGFLISAECLRECGLFDEELFIDCVDTEFCLRINVLGYRIAAGPGTDIRHSLGERMPLRPFGIQLGRNGRNASYEYHGPVRRYFIARNNVDLYLRYATVKPRWVLSAIKREFSPTVTTIVSGPHGVRQLVATLIGTTHGLIRRRGPLSPALRAILTPRRGARIAVSPAPVNPPQ